MSMISEFIKHYTAALLFYGRDDESEPNELDIADLSEDGRMLALTEN